MKANHEPNQNYMNGFETYFKLLVIGDKGRYYEENKMNSDETIKCPVCNKNIEEHIPMETELANGEIVLTHDWCFIKYEEMCQARGIKIKGV